MSDKATRIRRVSEIIRISYPPLIMLFALAFALIVAHYKILRFDAIPIATSLTLPLKTAQSIILSIVLTSALMIIIAVISNGLIFLANINSGEKPRVNLTIKTPLGAVLSYIFENKDHQEASLEEKPNQISQIDDAMLSVSTQLKRIFWFTGAFMIILFMVITGTRVHATGQSNQYCSEFGDASYITKLLLPQCVAIGTRPAVEGTQLSGGEISNLIHLSAISGKEYFVRLSESAGDSERIILPSDSIRYLSDGRLVSFGRRDAPSEAQKLLVSTAILQEQLSDDLKRLSNYDREHIDCLKLLSSSEDLASTPDLRRHPIYFPIGIRKVCTTNSDDGNNEEGFCTGQDDEKTVRTKNTASLSLVGSMIKDNQNVLERGEAVITIVGFADSFGTRYGNILISRDRAFALKDEIATMEDWLRPAMFRVSSVGDDPEIVRQFPELRVRPFASRAAMVALCRLDN